MTLFLLLNHGQTRVQLLPLWLQSNVEIGSQEYLVRTFRTLTVKPWKDIQYHLWSLNDLT